MRLVLVHHCLVRPFGFLIFFHLFAPLLAVRETLSTARTGRMSILVTARREWGDVGEDARRETRMMGERRTTTVARMFLLEGLMMLLRVCMVLVSPLLLDVVVHHLRPHAATAGYPIQTGTVPLLMIRSVHAFWCAIGVIQVVSGVRRVEKEFVCGMTMRRVGLCGSVPRCILT